MWVSCQLFTHRLISMTQTFKTNILTTYPKMVMIQQLDHHKSIDPQVAILRSLIKRWDFAKWSTPSCLDHRTQLDGEKFSSWRSNSPAGPTASGSSRSGAAVDLLLWSWKFTNMFTIIQWWSLKTTSKINLIFISRNLALKFHLPKTSNPKFSAVWLRWPLYCWKAPSKGYKDQ